MKKVNTKDDLQVLENMLKPQVTTLILGTLVFFAPYGNMLLKILNNENDGLLLTAILVFPSLLLLFTYWCWYLNSLKKYKIGAKEIFDIINNDK